MIQDTDLRQIEKNIEVLQNYDLLRALKKDMKRILPDIRLMICLLSDLSGKLKLEKKVEWKDYWQRFKELGL